MTRQSEPSVTRQVRHGIRIANAQSRDLIYAELGRATMRYYENPVWPDWEKFQQATSKCKRALRRLR